MSIKLSVRTIEWKDRMKGNGKKIRITVRDALHPWLFEQECQCQLLELHLLGRWIWDCQKSEVFLLMAFASRPIPFISATIPQKAYMRQSVCLLQDDKVHDFPDCNWTWNATMSHPHWSAMAKEVLFSCRWTHGRNSQMGFERKSCLYIETIRSPCICMKLFVVSVRYRLLHFIAAGETKKASDSLELSTTRPFTWHRMCLKGWKRQCPLNLWLLWKHWPRHKSVKPIIFKFSQLGAMVLF